MKRVPQASQVARALISAKRVVKQSLKGLNRAAGQLMAKGDYAGAETLAAKGRELQQFQTEVDALGKRWRLLARIGGGDGPAKQAMTPLWSYYQPILKAVAAAGGECRIAELEPQVERIMAGAFQPGDRGRLGRRERWQVMIRRARKHLVAEGWLDEDAFMTWRITDAGRQAAERPLDAAKQMVK